MNRYSRIFHHITTEDVKRKRRENIKVQEIKDELERERLEAIVEPVQHVDWRDDLKELAGFEWVVTPNGPTNSASTKFTGQYNGSATANTFTANGLGGSDVLPTSITVNIEGDSVSVDPPTYSQFPVAGLPMPVSAAIWRQQNEQKAEDINKRLSSSQEFAKKVEADKFMGARVSEPNAANRITIAAQVFWDYLHGKLKSGNWNKYLGKGYVKHAFRVGQLQGDGSIQVNDNVIGSAGQMVFDSKTNTWKMQFKGLGFHDNAKEFADNPDLYDEFWTKLFTRMGKYSAHAQPHWEVPIPVLNGWSKLLSIGFGGIFGKVIEHFKGKGGAQDVNAYLEMGANDLNKLNPKLITGYMNQKYGISFGSKVWNPNMMGMPFGTGPVHNYYLLTGQLPRGSVVQGSIPHNYGDHAEYDPKVIKQIDDIRKYQMKKGTGSDKTPLPNAPDSDVSDIRSKLSLDNLSATDKAILAGRKKKKRKNRVVATESKALSKIKNQFSYKGKPSPDGFPDAPPPKLKNGWHPGYGKKDNMYNRLDPISAKSMPKTGDPTIDKKVEKAKKKNKA